MAELSAVPFSALPQASDGYTVLYENDQVCRSEKKLSELVGNKTSSFLTKEQGDSLYQEKGDYLVEDDITGKLDKSQYVVDSATFLTAHQDISNKLDTTAFSTVSSNFLTAHQSLDEYATQEWVNNQGFLKEHQSISANEWNDVYETVVTNSGTWGTEKDWTDDINAASGYAYEQAVAQIPDPFDPTFLSGEIDKKLDKTFSSNFYPMNENPSGYLTGVDLSNYYTKNETSGKTEIANALTAKQNVIQSKKNSSLPYLETSNSEPSWEVIENEQINAHGTAQEGEVYNTTINGRTYTMVCLNGKLWLAENYVDEAKDIYTDSKYGSYFTEATIKLPTFVPQGWHLPTKEEYQELIDYTENYEKYLATTDWHTLNYHGNPDPNYIAGTNELKLNILPGGEYYYSTLHSNEYMARFWTNTDEILSQSTGKQRVYVRVSNYIGSTRILLSFDWSGPGSQNCYNVRLIKDDLDVSGPDCWKTFKGKNFMAIADNEGNTFKDFYLKKVEAQATYQPTGSYASSAGVVTLNTYYALTTTGWKDIAEGFYDKTSIDDSLSLKQNNLTFSGENNTITSINNSAIGGGSTTGEYVPLNAVECTIGSGNSSISGSLAQGENNLAGYSIVYPEETIQGELVPERTEVLGYSFAQGKENTAYLFSMAQGYHNKASYFAMAQGQQNVASNYAMAQGNYNSAIYYSFSQGEYNYAYTGVCFGTQNSAIMYSFTQGKTVTANNYSFAAGKYNYAENYSQTFGYGLKATNYATANGYEGAVITYGSFVIGEFNKTSAAPFVIGNGTSDNDRRDLFVVDKDGNVSAQGQIYAEGGILGASLDTLELAPDNETIEFVTSSHNVVNGEGDPEEYTVIKIKTSLLNKINELYNLVSSNSGTSNWNLPQ